jgi:uncharacterized damage-inducible protein DinB
VQDLLQRLFAHLQWADERTFAALRAQPDVPAAVLDRFMHVIAVEHLWLARIRGEAARVAVWPAFTAELCAALMAENHRGLAELARSDAAQLARVVAYVSSAGDAFENTVGDILLQVATHGCWHRGQVATLMRQAGLEPVPTDYIALARGAPAARS